jgi:hypothetical protein
LFVFYGAADDDHEGRMDHTELATQLGSSRQRGELDGARFNGAPFEGGHVVLFRESS